MQLLLSPIPLVIADCGKPLKWVENSDYWDFWRRELTPHLVGCDNEVKRDFAGDYCYVASEWTTAGAGPVILLELYRRDSTAKEATKPDKTDSRKKSSDLTFDLSDCDREFYLGLYRYAVQRYQPIIENRTGVCLGKIEVKNVSSLHQDFRNHLEKVIGYGIFGFLRKRSWKKRICTWADAAIGEIPPTSSAFYYHQSIYVAFTMGMQLHEDYVIPSTIHELAHRLWEKLGGPHGTNIRWRKERAYWKLKMLDEGYAEYAARIWFLDSYPLWLRRKIPAQQRNQSNIYVKGLRLMEKLVGKYGSQILLKIPGDWRKIISDNASAFFDEE
jgi:hypothetical protein